MTDFPLSRIGVTKIIDTGATLANGARAAATFDNTTDKAHFCDVNLTVYWNTTAPSVNTIVADLYLIYGDGEASESFPEGGDGTVGTDDTPEAASYVGSFETINPTTSTAEKLQIRGVPLRPITGNRFVIRNVSGQTFNNTWEVNITKYKPTAV